MSAFYCHYCKGFNVRKHGYFTPKNSHQPIRRYYCTSCKKTFSAHTQWLFHCHKKPQINRLVFNLLCSGMTQRRIAKVLSVSRTTVERKFLFLTKWAQVTHQNFCANYQLKNPIQFDEMESFEHTKLKPLNIALAVEASATGPYKILSIDVGQMKPKGHLANIKKYAPRIDTSTQAIESVLNAIKQFKPSKIRTDEKPVYKTKIAKYLGNVQHESYCRDASAIAGENKYILKKKYDPLFALNHTCARIRADISRMRRRFWGTTKTIEGLRNHLTIYMVYFNGLTLEV